MSEKKHGFMRRLLEPASIDEQAPVATVFTYLLLFIWSLVVLVPLYWVFITSFKGAGEVDNGPSTCRSSTSSPRWRRGISCCCVTTPSAPYEFAGGRARKHLARRADRVARGLCVGAPRFQVKLAAVGVFLVLLIAVIAAVATFGVPWVVAVAAALALFLIAMFTFIGRTELADGSNDVVVWIISTGSCRRSWLCCRYT